MIPVKYNSRMPAFSDRLHLDHGMQQWLGDSPKSVIEASKKPVGRDNVRAIDNNIRASLDGIVVVHGTTPAEMGYRYIWQRKSPGIRRKLTEKELHTPFEHMTSRKITMLRRTRVYGKSYESRVRINTLLERMKQCKRYSVHAFYEAKSIIFGDDPKYAKMANHWARITDTPPWFFTISNMKNMKGKAILFDEADNQFAISAHGPMPHDFRQWQHHVVHVFGASWAGK